MEWVALIVIGILIWVAFKYWYITLLIAGAIWAVWWYNKERAEAAERDREQAERDRAQAERLRIQEADRVRARAQAIAAQEAMGRDLVALTSDSLKLFVSMPRTLLTAEEFLDQAERDFEESAFSPFWTSIERATSQLGAFDGTVLTISRSLQNYQALAGSYEGKAPSFPVSMKSVHGMAAASTTAVRLNDAVRKAQTNFQFAMIYEQRKTNQLLVAGFTNLAQALDGMGQRIGISIDQLGREVSAMSSAMQESFQSLGESVEAGFQALGESVEAGSQKIVESVNTIHVTSKKNAGDVKGQHDRALQMLDNIQRRRTPYPRRLGDGRY